MGELSRTDLPSEGEFQLRDEVSGGVNWGLRWKLEKKECCEAEDKVERATVGWAGCCFWLRPGTGERQQRT